MMAAVDGKWRSRGASENCSRQFGANRNGGDLRNSGWSRQAGNRINNHGSGNHQSREWKANSDEKMCITIASDKVGKIIGRHGVKIRELQEETGTTINVSKTSLGHTTKVTIMGCEEDQKKCAELINNLIKDNHPAISDPTPKDNHQGTSDPTPKDNHQATSDPTPTDNHQEISDPTPKDNDQATSDPTPKDNHQEISDPSPKDNHQATSDPTPPSVLTSRSPCDGKSSLRLSTRVNPAIIERINARTYPVVDWVALKKKSEEFERLRWSKCPPLKKNFYIEDPEVANMSDSYVEKLRKSLNNITVSYAFKGEQKIPNPVETFEQAFKHYPDILNEIKKQGFKTPFPIQCQAWPILLSGRDMIGIAQTGTGKTLAFLLPALIHTYGQEVPLSERGGPNVLVLAPTRELAQQIEKEVQKYSYRNIKSVCVYGGGNRREQISEVTKGVQIIIATPGRLNDLIMAGAVKVESVTFLILDEADRMLDMGFEPQIRKILLDIRPDKQTVMTSATWPELVQNLASKYMSDPVQVVVGSLDLAAVHSVTQTIRIVNEEDKFKHLMDIIKKLKRQDKIIVFVDKKAMADQVSSDLALARVYCDCIHGSREQSDREQAIEDLKNGSIRILIATDVASRGIDILDITKVINFDFPRNIEEYVHRVGRTGRAGKTGESITFFTRNDWSYAGDLISILEEASQDVPEELYNMKMRYEAAKEKRKNMGRRGRGRRFEDDFRFVG